MASTISDVLDARVTRVAPFTTRQRRDPVGYVRTRGVVVHGRDDDLALAGVPLDDPFDVHAARGKVAVLRDDGALLVRVRQRSASGDEACTVACSNATAAAGAVSAGAWSSSFTVALPAGQTVAVETRASHLHTGELAVVQTWRDVTVAVADAGVVAGRRVAVCSGPLNDYVLVAARRDEPLAALSVAEARWLWCHFGFLDAPLRARLAFLAGAGPRPDASFFTCGGRPHPSAPLTGLAVLAAAQRNLDWPELHDLEAVVTRAGPIAVPRVEVTGRDTTTFEFPAVVVRLGRT